MNKYMNIYIFIKFRQIHRFVIKIKIKNFCKINPLNLPGFLVTSSRGPSLLASFISGVSLGGPSSTPCPGKEEEKEEKEEEKG